MQRDNKTHMLTYNLEARGTTSVYDYLYQLIRDDIAHGIIPRNTKLPSKRALAQHLGIGVATVAAAYEQLVTEGFVRAEQRRGFFVEDVSRYRSKPVTGVGIRGLCSERGDEGRDGRGAGADANPESAALGASCGAGACGGAGTSSGGGAALPAATAPSTAKAAESAYDQNFFVDMKANRTSIDLFPTSVWARYMREALALPAHKLLQSVPFNGLPELRRAIADYLRRARGMNVSPESIIIGAGSEYLYGRLLQMMGPATTFAMENPGYRKFAAISQSYGNPWVSVPIDDAGMIVDALEDSGADVAHVSAANHFPTGVVMPITRRLELFEWAGRARKRFIIEDDYDSEFRYTGRPIMPLFADDAAGKVIYLNAFSKTMMPSLRISYLVLPERLMERYLDTMSFYACTVSSVEQYALARFIDEGHLERHINRMRTFYRNQRASVLGALKASPLASISTVEERNAGTHFLLHVRTELGEEEVRRRGGAAGLNISMLSDYRFGEDEGVPAWCGRAARRAARQAGAEASGREGGSAGQRVETSSRPTAQDGCGSEPGAQGENGLAAQEGYGNEPGAQGESKNAPAGISGYEASGARALTIVVNYAGISPDRIEESIRRLAGIFPECAG